MVKINIPKTLRWLLISSLIITFIACFSSKHYSREIEEVIAATGKTFVPDKRLGVWDIQAEYIKNSVILKGETTSSPAYSTLQQTLPQKFPGIEFQFQIKTLPDSALNERSGIVRVCVAHIRRKPDVRAEMISQAIMGSTVEILKSSSGYYFVRMEDGYLGWVSDFSVITGDASLIQEWEESPLGVFLPIQGLIYQDPSPESYPISDIVMGCKVKILNQTGDFYRVEIADGRIGFIPSHQLLPYQDFKQIKPKPEKIIDLALRLRGISYTWGGTSTKGFDCSGFTQTVFKMNGISLLRDANMQVTQGVEVDTSNNFAHLQPADLLFFGPTESKITHVGIYLGNKKFIHESGMVKINSLDPADDTYSPYRTRNLRKVKRIITDI